MPLQPKDGLEVADEQEVLVPLQPKDGREAARINHMSTAPTAS